MKKQTKIKFLAVFLILGIAISGFAQTPPSLSDLQNGVADFSEALAKSLPFNSALGLNWADAHIGKFFPSLPPHFGVGGSFGITTMELPVIETLAGYLGYDFPFGMGKLPLPTYTAEARIGGFFLPFDVGVKYGYLPEVGLWGKDLNLDFLFVGADIRYAVINNAVLPKLSVGVGFNYLRGGLGAKVGSSDQNIDYPGLSGTNTIIIERPDINLKWESKSIDFKVQISKSLLIITPYVGVGGTYAWSNAGYAVDSRITHKSAGGSTTSLTTADIDEINNYLAQAGLDGVDIDESGLSSIIENKDFSLRAFGGLSLNLAIIKIDLTGLYNFRDQNYGASVGLRLQI